MTDSGAHGAGPSGSDPGVPVGPGGTSSDGELPDTRVGRAERRAAERRQRRHPLLRRTGRVVASLVVLALLLTGAAILKLNGNINRIDVSGLLGKDRPTPKNKGGAASGPLNLMVLGSDTRQGEGNQGFGDGSWEPGAHSDTNLLVHLSGDRSSVMVVSIPRDSMVPGPPTCSPSVPKADWAVRQWNYNFKLGGPGCTIRAFEGNTGIFVDHFVVVDFNGFKGMVDALGGVDVCTTKSIDDKASKLHLSPGRHRLDGEQALGYVRARKTLGDGSDLGRIKRQQAFMSSVAQEATQSSLLLRPDKLFRFLDAATRSLTTDGDFGLGDMKDVAESVKNIGVNKIQFVTVPTQTYPKDPNRVEWTSGADVIWQAIRDDVPLGASAIKKTPSPTVTDLTVSPERIQVHVVNASGTTGLGRQAAAALEVQGFPNVRFSSGSSPTGPVVLTYPAGMGDAAKTVAAAFPGAKAHERKDEEFGTGDEIVVTLGPGAPTVHEIPNRLGSDPLPSPSVTAPSAQPSASPSIPARTADQDICS